MPGRKAVTKPGVCKRHRCPILPELGRCLKCEESAQQSAFEQDLAEHDETLLRLKAYKGDSFLVESYMADGFSREHAIAAVQNPVGLDFWIGTPYIDKDRYLAEAIGKAIARRDPAIMQALAEREKPVKRRGTKVKPETGQFQYERIAELTAEGKADWRIASEVFGDSTKASLVTAHRDRDHKRLEKLYAVKRPSRNRQS